MREVCAEQERLLRGRVRVKTIGMAMLIAACAIGGPAWADAAPEPPSAATVTASANDTAGDASVGVGEHLVVRLPVSGGTGYSWSLASEAGPELALSDQRMERAAARLGAPQLAVFDFEAQAAGQKELTFQLSPPGAGGEAQPAKSYVLTVTVSE
jgi:predicted secreted protein